MVPLLYYGLAVVVTSICLLYASWGKWTSKYFFLPQPNAIPWLGASLSIPIDPHKFFLMVP